jgi:hypothetical protein
MWVLTQSRQTSCLPQGKLGKALGFRSSRQTSQVMSLGCVVLRIVRFVERVGSEKVSRIAGGVSFESVRRRDLAFLSLGSEGCSAICCFLFRRVGVEVSSESSSAGAYCGFCLRLNLPVMDLVTGLSLAGSMVLDPPSVVLIGVGGTQLFSNVAWLAVGLVVLPLMSLFLSFVNRDSFESSCFGLPMLHRSCQVGMNRACGQGHIASKWIMVCEIVMRGHSNSNP